MNIPHQLQQEAEVWATRQGITLEQFILQAVTEKITALNQPQTPIESITQSSQTVQRSPDREPRIYRKEGILVIETEPLNNLDINSLISEVREERIQEQMHW